MDEIIDGTTYSTYFEYDVAGSLGSVTDAQGHVTSILYDLAGRKTQLTDPDIGVTGYAYDRNGNLLARAIPGGTTETWEYDALDRSRKRFLGTQLEAEWIYDLSPNGRGLLHKRVDGAGSYEVLSYDKLGRATSEKQTPPGGGPAHTFSTTYDWLGQIATRSYPGGVTLRWARDAKGFLEEILRVGGPATSYASMILWDAHGRVKSWRAGNGLVSTATFDGPTARLTRVTVAGASSLEDTEYTYFNDDQVDTVTDHRESDWNRSFVYDSINRLVTATGPYGAQRAPATLRFKHDPIGNLTCSGAQSPATACSVDKTLVYGGSKPHQAVSIGGETPVYGPTGNLTSLGDRGYAYDLLDRLTVVSEGGTPAGEYTYDASGARARSVDHKHPVTRTTYFLAADFEWDATRGLGLIHVEVGGAMAATIVEPYAPSSGAGIGLWWSLPGGATPRCPRAGGRARVLPSAPPARGPPPARPAPRPAGPGGRHRVALPARHVGAPRRGALRRRPQRRRRPRRRRSLHRRADRDGSADGGER